MKLLVSGLISFLLTYCPCAQSSASQASYNQITAAYQQGRLEDAEKQLRALLETHPSEIRALSLMAVVLDGQKRYAEAEPYYLKAIGLAPPSASLYNNLGNHYTAQAKRDKAQNAFLRALAIDPGHVNAALQMAQIHLRKKEFVAALRRLDRLPAAELNSASVQLLRARALFGSGEKEQAQKLLESLEAQAAGDLRLTFALGMAYVDMERFADAESAFIRVLQADPANPEVLYNLGTAALRAGHLDRAQSVYQRVLSQKPGDVDSLVGLARALAASKQGMQALPLLVQAGKLAPTRSDILSLMAETTSALGLYGDAAVAYEKYLKLEPDDDVARRERGYALVRSARIQEGIQDLQWYISKHPGDKQGHFQLAVALSFEDKVRALEEINRALELDPKSLEARYARGVLSQRLGRNRESAEDLQAYLQHNPADVKAHEELARAYLSNQQPQLAAETLKKALALAPQTGSLYFHYSRAMRSLGKLQEMKDAITKFEQLGGGKESSTPRPGVLDFLSLSPAEQQSRYIANLKNAILQRPDDSELKMRLLGVYLPQGNLDEARPLLDEVRRVGTDAGTLARCIRLLVEGGFYHEALPFVDAAIRQGSATDETYLDQALTVLHTAGAEKALTTLDALPSSLRTGDYHLLKAQILDSLGRFDDAVAALNEALRTAPTRADLYFQACSFLIKHRRFEESLELLKTAEINIPGSPDLMLARAIVLELQNQSHEASQQLVQIQSRWPEWPAPYVIHGVVLGSQHQAAEAKQMLETAIALGTMDPAAYYHLTLAIRDLTPNDHDSAYKTIVRGLRLDPADPYMQALAGRIALDMKDFPAALSHLQEAIHLYPEMADAHWLLANLYRVTGQDEKQKIELAEVSRLNKLFPPGTQTPPSMQDLLFSVRKPGPSGGQRPTLGPKP